MRLLCAGVVDVDLGATFGIVVWVGAVVHDFAGEGDNGFILGGVGVVAAGTEAGSVVRHVAFVGVGDEWEDSENEVCGLHDETVLSK